jgi:translation initiation factor 4E
VNLTVSLSLCQNSTYQSNLQKIATFGTVEDFWRHYIHIKRPSQLSRDVNLYLFRDRANCSPMWEAFPNGGCWILKIKKKANVLGKMWQDLVFAAIGEAFEELDVVGIAMAIRSKEDMLSVWNADNTNEETRFKIGYTCA